ncbi:hypothetical protein, partial [Serratia marcescens]|uniref:hypothetical protein n=1 Tax=Serratia marcescens TaxID=615 RepID=UPI0028143812
GIFNLDNEGTLVLTDIPDDVVNKMLNVFGREPLAKRSGKKSDLKTEFRYLHDVISKGLLAKEGAFDAFTEERFILMTI